MRTLLFQLFLTCCFSLVLVSAALSQGQQQPDMAEMMKKWKEASSPNEHHAKFASMVGKWTTETSTWMSGPGQPPAVSKGTAEMSLSMDGRFLVQNTKGEFMGGPFTGMGLTGYDNMKKCYTMFWVDNSSSSMSTAEGNYDMDGKNLIMYGKMDEPMTGEHDKNVKYVLRAVDNDHYTFEIHDLIYGESNTKTMEIKYSRVK